ncbi:MAG: methionine synthase [Betaproteobacteria bacterium]|nr:methionine synthase [Betaproteobacteria bacterium]
MTTNAIKTTIAGSLPKPAWLAKPQVLWAPWQLEGEALAEGKRDAVRSALKMQETAGIDIVGDGEQTRMHFVHGFLQGVEGVDFSRLKRIGIRADRYEADCPTVSGPVARKNPVHVDDVRFARANTTNKMKFTLPGPMTMVDTLADEYYKDRAKLAFALAELLNAEARELAALGVDTIQFDEPAFNVFLEDVRDWGIAALERAAQGLTCTTAVHICYGYGIKANDDWKRTLGGQWRQYESTFPLLAKSSIKQVSLECANSHVPMELISLLKGKDVLVGAIDVASNTVETPEEVAATLRRALQFVPLDHLHGCTNCGMAPIARPIAQAKLHALTAGARLLSRELGVA